MELGAPPEVVRYALQQQGLIAPPRRPAQRTSANNKKGPRAAKLQVPVQELTRLYEENRNLVGLSSWLVG